LLLLLVDWCDGLVFVYLSTYFSFLFPFGFSSLPSLQLSLGFKGELVPGSVADSKI
jgi:hypothetical protein